MSAGGYEKRDVRTGWILIIVAMMAVSAVVVHAQVWYLFDHYRAAYQSRDVRRTRIDVPQTAPVEPLLEVSPTANWDAYRAKQERDLTTYGWASREEQRVRIPIERAMELTVEGK